MVTTVRGRAREGWFPLWILYLSATVTLALVIVTWWAHDWEPFNGTKGEWVFGLLFASLGNFNLGALAYGMITEYRHPARTRLRGIDHLMAYFALLGMAAIDVGLIWWLAASAAGGYARWLFLIFALVSGAVGAAWGWLVIWPRHRWDDPYSGFVARSAMTVARQPVLIFLVVIAFLACAVFSLALSGLIFYGWWEGFFLEIGVGLLVTGIIDLVVLSALNTFLEAGKSKASSSGNSTT